MSSKMQFFSKICFTKCNFFQKFASQNFRWGEGILKAPPPPSPPKKNPSCSSSVYCLKNVVELFKLNIKNSSYKIRFSGLSISLVKQYPQNYSILNITHVKNCFPNLKKKCFGQRMKKFNLSYL
jgi:hypothetical protein